MDIKMDDVKFYNYTKYNKFCIYNILKYLEVSEICRILKGILILKILMNDDFWKFKFMNDYGQWFNDSKPKDMTYFRWYSILNQKRVFTKPRPDQIEDAKKFEWNGKVF